MPPATARIEVGRLAPARPREFEVVLEFRAMGTNWRVGADGAASGTIEAVRELVEHEEQRCSRFRADSALSRLNATRVTSDRTLGSLVREALDVSAATAGAFDPTVGDAVIAAGYDRTFAGMTGFVDVNGTRASSRPRVDRGGSSLRLSGEGAIDLGGIAKGWTVDRVAESLIEAGSARWLVDAGGDIRAGGAERSVCIPIAVDLTGLTVGLEGGAVATSSTLRRAWDTPGGRMHHIISPHTGRPSAGPYVLATVVAPEASTADALATALLVDMPATLAAFPLFEAEALLFDDQGNGTMTPGMEAHLV